jgi:hypothetical protein
VQNCRHNGFVVKSHVRKDAGNGDGMAHIGLTAGPIHIGMRLPSEQARLSNGLYLVRLQVRIEDRAQVLDSNPDAIRLVCAPTGIQWIRLTHLINPCRH